MLPLLLSYAGLGVAGYLSWTRLWGLFSAGSGPCDIVQASPHARLAGVPIAYLDFAMYALVLGLVLYRRKATGRPYLYALFAQFGVVLMGTLNSVSLTYAEVFIIRAVCPWCVASALIVTGLLVLTYRDLGRTIVTGSPADR